MAAPITVTLVEDGQVYTLRDLCALHKAKFPTIRARWRRMGCPELVPLALITDGPRQAANRGGYIIGKHGRPKLVVHYPPHGRLSFAQIAELHPELGRGHQYFKARWIAAGRPSKVEAWIFTAPNKEFVARYGRNGYRMARDPREIVPADPRYVEDWRWPADVPFADLMHLSYERNTGAGRGSIPDEEWIGRIGVTPKAAALGRII